MRGESERKDEKEKEEFEKKIYSDRERINRATAKAALNNARGAKSMEIVAEKVTKRERQSKERTRSKLSIRKEEAKKQI